MESSAEYKLVYNALLGQRGSLFQKPQGRRGEQRTIPGAAASEKRKRGRRR